MCYTGAMVHPGGGRNDIPNRLKRQFCLLNVTMPSLAAIDNIFGTIIRGRLSARVVPAAVADVAARLTDATIVLWRRTSSRMLPTPAKFHYQFNMRELSRVFGGIFQVPPHPSPLNPTAAAGVSGVVQVAPRPKPSTQLSCVLSGILQVTPNPWTLNPQPDTSPYPRARKAQP